MLLIKAKSRWENFSTAFLLHSKMPYKIMNSSESFQKGYFSLISFNWF
jgi:hypothetical protein